MLTQMVKVFHTVVYPHFALDGKFLGIFARLDWSQYYQTVHDYSTFFCTIKSRLGFHPDSRRTITIVQEMYPKEVP